MGIIMNAFIANVIKPNITSVQDEADSTVLTKRLEMGLSCLHQETGLKQRLTGCVIRTCVCQLRMNLSLVDAEMPATWLQGTSE